MLKLKCVEIQSSLGLQLSCVEPLYKATEINYVHDFSRRCSTLTLVIRIENQKNPIEYGGKFGLLLRLQIFSLRA